MDHPTHHDDEQEHNRQQIEIMYRGYGKHYTDIVRSMSDKLFNWAFTLNTGGLAVSITFMSATIKWDAASWQTLISFFILIFIFSLGIGCIVLAAKLEHSRFNQKGLKLDSYMDEFNAGKISMPEFINKLPPKIPCLDFFVSKIENGSYYIFFLGIVSALVIIGLKMNK